MQIWSWLRIYIIKSAPGLRGVNLELADQAPPSWPESWRNLRSDCVLTSAVFRRIAPSTHMGNNEKNKRSSCFLDANVEKQLMGLPFEQNACKKQRVLFFFITEAFEHHWCSFFWLAPRIGKPLVFLICWCGFLAGPAEPARAIMQFPRRLHYDFDGFAPDRPFNIWKTTKTHRFSCFFGRKR